MTDERYVKILAIARETKTGHYAPLKWVWPDSRNRFNTGLPTPRKKHKNAHKCNWTPLPSCANKRHKKVRNALSL